MIFIVCILQSWDPDLAKTAKGWAKKCLFKHNTYLKDPGQVHPKFTSVGENLWTGSLSLFTVQGAITSWYNEVSAYTYATNKCTGICGHYTQVGITFLHQNYEQTLPFGHRNSRMDCFPSAVVLFCVCVHKIFSCPHFREEKSHCIIVLNMLVVFSTYSGQPDTARQRSKPRQRAAMHDRARSQLWQAASTYQELGKYQNMKRSLEFCKHHVCASPDHNSQRGPREGEECHHHETPAVINHGCGRVGQLQTVALGIRF